MTTGEDRLSQHAAWINNAALRLSRMYRIEYEECVQILGVAILRERSRRLAWLETRKEIEAEYLQRSVTQDGSFEALRDHGSKEIELVTRMMDIELILSAEELVIVKARVEGQSEQEIGLLIGLGQPDIAKRLKVIRKKILAYYAN